MDAFRFSPELLEVRNDVIALLDDAGYMWLSDYGCVDCRHDLYGIEVCGIHDQEDAIAMGRLLRKAFPRWKKGNLYYDDEGCDIGWKVKIHRDKPEINEDWKTS